MMTTAATTNSTEGENVTPLGIVTIIVLLCLCGLAGNGTIIWFLRFGVKKSPYSIYIFNLAIADFLFLLCMALSHVFNRPEFGLWSQTVSEAFKRIRYLAYTLGLSLLATISTQRCLSVLFPIWYRCHRPQHLSLLVCAVLWLVAILENLVAVCFCVIQKETKNSCQKVDLFFVVLVFGVFAPIMCVSGLILFIKVRRVSLKRQPARLYTTILATILVFLICALPLAVYWFILYWLKISERPKMIFYDVAKIFSCVNSTANPIIYFTVGNQRDKRVQEPLRVRLVRALGDEETSPTEMVELRSDRHGAQDEDLDTKEKLPGVTARYRDPQPV